MIASTPSSIAAQLDALFRLSKRELIATVMRLVRCRSTAEDLAQEAYLRVLTLRDPYRVERLRPFLFRTAHNLAMDHLRAAKVRRRFAYQSRVSATATLVADANLSDHHADLSNGAESPFFSALQGLSERQQRVVYMARIEGLPYATIATTLGVSVSTVEKDLRAALRHCLAALADA
jgi:RNA polymerase sigma factor (sigma-70 family)